jgi:hypothetical protein
MMFDEDDENEGDDLFPEIEVKEDTKRKRDDQSLFISPPRKVINLDFMSPLQTSMLLFLPFPIIGHIFAYAAENPSILLKITLVCKRFRWIVTVYDELIWKACYEHLIGNPPPSPRGPPSPVVEKGPWILAKPVEQFELVNPQPITICWREECMREVKKRRDDVLRRLEEKEQLEREERENAYRQECIRRQLDEERSKIRERKFSSAVSPDFILFDVSTMKKTSMINLLEKQNMGDRKLSTRSKSFH